MSARNRQGIADGASGSQGPDARAPDGAQSWTYGLLALQWGAGLFIFLSILPFASPNLIWALGIGGGLVLIANTASVLGWTNFVLRDRRAVYDLDASSVDHVRK